MNIRINQIEIGENRRAVNPEKVKELSESIKEIGLLNPITITEKNKLIAGAHRIDAFKLLNREEIPCNIVSFSDVEEERLAEIDENLIRNDLSRLEQAICLKERNEILERMGERAESGTNLKNLGTGDNLSPVKTTQDIAAEVGLSKRGLQRSLQIAKNITEDVKESLMDTPVADNQEELLILARSKPDDQREIRDKIIHEGVKSVKQAVGIIKIEKRRADLEKQQEDIDSGNIKLPEGVFEVIVVDPPWPYETKYNPEGRRAANPYPEMPLHEIIDLRIPSAENCILWLWTTHKFMRNSFEILDNWGFQEKAILTWVKDRMGLGSWLRSQSEFCIMAVKGNPKINLTNQTTVINGPLREHSRKPEEFYNMVNGLCIGRKLDYFSRKEREGWFCYGNDIKKFGLE